MPALVRDGGQAQATQAGEGLGVPPRDQAPPGMKRVAAPELLDADRSGEVREVVLEARGEHLVEP